MLPAAAAGYTGCRHRTLHPVSLPQLICSPASPCLCYPSPQAQYEERRGIKISVYTEADLSSLSATEQFGIFCDATASEGQLSFTFVCRQDFVSGADARDLHMCTAKHKRCRRSHTCPPTLPAAPLYFCRRRACAAQDDMFVGVTTRNHTDCKGSQVPSFGWKRNGCIYSGKRLLRAPSQHNC